MSLLADKTATLEIHRGDGEKTRIEQFEIAFEDGESVLDALVKLRKTRDASLAFRYSCFNANVCKECTMLIDGEVGYACTAKLKQGAMRLEPLPGKPVLRDLMTDTLSAREKP